jgi:hypothetical protein
VSVTPQVSPAGDKPAGRAPITAFAAGAIFFGFALIGAWSIASDPYLPMGRSGADPGPAFVPWIAIAILGLGGFAQMVFAAFKASKTGGFVKTGEFVLSKLALPVALVLSLIALQMALKPLGTLVACIIFALPWVFILHWRAGGKFTPRYLVQLPIEAILIVAGIYYLFAKGINVPLP